MWKKNDERRLLRRARQRILGCAQDERVAARLGMTIKEPSHRLPSRADGIEQDGVFSLGSFLTITIFPGVILFSSCVLCCVFVLIQDSIIACLRKRRPCFIYIVLFQSISNTFSSAFQHSPVIQSFSHFIWLLID
jgi:hypothetical protein